MKINCLPAEKKINKGYLKANIVRDKYDRFLLAFNKLMLHINDSESEEYNKNIIKTFLEDSFYKNHNFINTKDRKDLVIHRDNKPSSPVVVLVEAKSPANSSEMISFNKLNKKAFHELVLYYLRERIENRNYEIKKLVITNAYEWFIFDASDFEKYFYVSEFKKEYEKWRDSAFVDVKTKTFYDFTEYKLRELDDEIDCVHLDLMSYAPKNFLIKKQTDEDMTTLYKVFSPEFLTGKSYANDSNSLNKEFYYELLYIMGLEEVSEGSKKLIKRCGTKTRQDASIVENIIRKLESENRLDNIENIKEFGSTKEEQLFNIALQLALTWLNRILFMKLLESQLIRFNNGDKYYKFLDAGKITQFNDLNTFFFKVLNIREDERYKDLREKFEFLPYLNSSLFEITDLERNATDISGLEDNLTMSLYSKTVLKDNKGNRSKTKLLTQEYLLLFLDAYDFGQTVSKEIVDEDKPLINASVLGLVFEKINGYKDGSYFTPGFITMYMARESVRLATIQKFNDKFGWKVENFVSLFNEITRIGVKEANDVIDDLKICDPAVGSGHFLVSVLNEIIAMKSELELLTDKDGKRIQDLHITVINDELHIENDKGDLFDYTFVEGDSEKGRRVDIPKQRVQEAIFKEKQRIIENCLFGVDINPNSVQICRLRLWIELLKNAYYIKERNYKTMMTLPNIDINIKCGNSLVSKYGFDGAMAIKDLSTLNEYKIAVATYKNTTDRNVKSELKKTIEKIKSKFKGFWEPENKERMKLAEELYKMESEKIMFVSDNTDVKYEAKKKKLTDKMEKLKEEEEKTNGNGLYWNAFEWRFEFPEVLDDNGNFTGFDIVIGNPPYGVTLSEELKNYFRFKYEAARTRKNGNVDDDISIKGSLDTFALFIERGLNLLHKDTMLSMIVPLAFTSSESMVALHNKIFDECKSIKVSTYSNRPKKVFDNADQRVSVIIANKTNTQLKELLTTKVIKRYFNESIKDVIENMTYVNSIDFKKHGRIPKIGTKIEISILKKLFSAKTSLKDLIVEKRGSPIYYRTSGGRYYNIITNFSTKSNKENSFKVTKKNQNIISAILSSNLYFWFYHIYSNNLDLKTYELEIFPLPIDKFSDNQIKEIEKLYKEYLKDLHKNSKIKKVNYAHVSEYREYYARYSKHLIDQIDLAIQDAYGLTNKEINFIINYDLKFRTDEDEE